VGSGRVVHGKENPRRFYAVGLQTEPAPIVRGSSRRITIMRFRPANIRVINRRENYLDHDLRCLLRGEEGRGRRNQLLAVAGSFHIRPLGALRIKIASQRRQQPKCVYNEGRFSRPKGIFRLRASSLVYSLLMAISQKRSVPKAHTGASQRTGPRRPLPPIAKTIPADDSKHPHAKILMSVGS